MSETGRRWRRRGQQQLWTAAKTKVLSTYIVTILSIPSLTHTFESWLGCCTSDSLVTASVSTGLRKCTTLTGANIAVCVAYLFLSPSCLWHNVAFSLTPPHSARLRARSNIVNSRRRRSNACERVRKRQQEHYIKVVVIVTNGQSPFILYVYSFGS